MQFIKKKKIIVGKSMTLEMNVFYTPEGLTANSEFVRSHQNHQIAERIKVCHLTDKENFESKVKSALGNQD